jgi:hypothetical protein
MNTMNYGFKFTEIIIKKDLFIKKAKNDEGGKKIEREIQFYIELQDRKINLCMPELIYYKKNEELCIKFIESAVNLTDIINKTNWKLYVDLIYEKLKDIHNITIEKSSESILTDITIETYDKILKRYNETDWVEYSDFNKIKYVNNIKIKDINYYAKLINERIKKIIREKNINEYNLIHGDTHLGNILVSNTNLYFIDPRGYFGNTELYGLKNYDYAKLLFGISGYSIFDTMTINLLTIENENINIDFIQNYEYIFAEDYFDELTILFALSIWLGNNSCFLDMNKKITSLMIAYYYCEKYLCIQ